MAIRNNEFDATRIREKSEELRQAAADYILNNRHNPPFRHLLDALGHMDINAVTLYTNVQRIPCTSATDPQWGDHIHLEALLRVLNMRGTIWSESAETGARVSHLLNATATEGTIEFDYALDSHYNLVMTTSAIQGREEVRKIRQQEAEQIEQVRQREAAADNRARAASRLLEEGQCQRQFVSQEQRRGQSLTDRARQKHNNSNNNSNNNNSNNNNSSSSSSSSDSSNNNDNYNNNRPRQYEQQRGDEDDNSNNNNSSNNNNDSSTESMNMATDTDARGESASNNTGPTTGVQSRKRGRDDSTETNHNYNQNRRNNYTSDNDNNNYNGNGSRGHDDHHYREDNEHGLHPEVTHPPIRSNPTRYQHRHQTAPITGRPAGMGMTGSTTAALRAYSNNRPDSEYTTTWGQSQGSRSNNNWDQGRQSHNNHNNNNNNNNSNNNIGYNSNSSASSTNTNSNSRYNNHNYNYHNTTNHSTYNNTASSHQQQYQRDERYPHAAAVAEGRMNERGMGTSTVEADTGSVGEDNDRGKGTVGNNHNRRDYQSQTYRRNSITNASDRKKARRLRSGIEKSNSQQSDDGDQ